MKTAITRFFQDRFQATPDLIVRSPGRINIIGEHTDYNDGFVLPAAIDKAVYVAVKAREDDNIRLYAEEFNETYTGTLQDVRPLKSWTDYILGVVDQLTRKGCTLKGFDLVLTGNIPIGAGLSSSAAVECACVFAFNELFSLGFDRMQLVHMARQAEHDFAGVKCGIMDQFASMFGKKDHVIKLDCRSLAYEYEPLDLRGIDIVLFNTNVKHSLSSSEYNVRQQQCEQGVALVKKKHPEVNSLRDITATMLEESVRDADPLVYRRCRYVVEENVRLLAACNDLREGNIAALGKRMLQTHDGLSRDYEVSCPELDFLVTNVKDNPAVLGARMVGGGFGGCTINLVRQEALESLTEQLARSYREKMGMELSTYIASAEDGTSLL